MPILYWIRKWTDYFCLWDKPTHLTWIKLNTEVVYLSEIWQQYQLFAYKEPEWSTESINISYSSSNTSIATVDSNWLITCVSPWKCIITATDSINWYSVTADILKWLPSTYQWVEYIQSSGTQYIDTWITLDTDNKLDNLEMYMKASHSWNWNFMWLYNWSYVAMEVPSNANTTLRCFIWNSSTYIDKTTIHDNYSVIDEITYKYTSSLATFSINWSNYKEDRSTWYNTWNVHMTIFARNNNWNIEQYLSMKMYSCYIKIAWETVRNFIPCYRKSDNVVWLYDTINEIFYTNSWSWEFTYWPNEWISLNNESISLTSAWQTIQLVATTHPDSAWNIWYTWESSNTSIATVNENWLVTCVTPWQCTITVTTNDLKYTNTCTVIPYEYKMDYIVVWWGWWGWWGWRNSSWWGWWAVCLWSTSFIWYVNVVIWQWWTYQNSWNWKWCKSCIINVNKNSCVIANWWCPWAWTSRHATPLYWWDSWSWYPWWAACWWWWGRYWNSVTSWWWGWWWGAWWPWCNWWNDNWNYWWNWWPWICWYWWGWWWVVFNWSCIWLWVDWWWDWNWSNATNYWWWWWSANWSWCQWLVAICYKTDWSCCFTCATGWDCCVTCNWYKIHYFTNNWSFKVIQ